METPNTLAGMSNPGTAAPAATPAPAAATPDQTTPAVPAGVQQAADQYQQSVADYQTAAKAPLNVAPVPGIATGPHARLINMISGLALGADAFGKAIATHGREGGVQEVQQSNAQKQQMQQSAQQAAQAQRNAELTQKLTTVQTNQQLMQNHLMLAKLPTELSMETLQKQQAEQGLATGEADFRASHFGMSPTDFNSMLSGTGTGGVQNVSILRSGIQQKLAAATQNPEVGADDKYVKAVQDVLANPNATPKDLWTASQQLDSQINLRHSVTAAKTASEAATANSPVAKLSTPEVLAAPGAQAAIQAKIDDPSTSPEDVARLRPLIAQAAVAQNNAFVQEQRKALATQMITQGSPAAAGKLLADRTLTLDEMKVRGMTPQFQAAAVEAAQKIDPTFKAAEASGQARIAASPANAQFFGNTDSLLVRGGTLDQLDSAGAALGNTKLPVLNTVENWRKAALGQGPQAAYAAAALGVADDYSKVMSGGQGSDTSREQALNIIKANQSPEAHTAAIKQIRSAVESQRNGRVSTNPYLRDMYPDPSTLQETPGVAGATRISPTPQTHVFNSQAWAQANPGKDVNAAIAQAKATGYRVQ